MPAGAPACIDRKVLFTGPHPAVFVSIRDLMEPADQPTVCPSCTFSNSPGKYPCDMCGGSLVECAPHQSTQRYDFRSSYTERSKRGFTTTAALCEGGSLPFISLPARPGASPLLGWVPRRLSGAAGRCNFWRASDAARRSRRLCRTHP